MTGIARPHAKTLGKLARGLGVDVDELFIDPRLCEQHSDHADVLSQVVDILDGENGKLLLGIVELLWKGR